MSSLAAIVEKEWLELRAERTLLATMAALPLLLTGLSVGMTFLLGQIPDPETAMLGAAMADPALMGLPLEQLGQVIVGRQFGTLLLLLPLLLPGLLAAHSIVGEKSRRTLEPLLATPVRTWELLLAKSLLAVLPAVLITWLCAAGFALGVGLVALTPQVVQLIIGPAWVALLLLCSPLLALIMVGISVLISSRVNDPRTAQSLTGVVVVPLMLLFSGQLLGLVVLDSLFVLALFVALVAIAGGLFWLAARLFQRETILTRWT
jgi:ABC-2 type transport system permease protein